MKIVIVLDEGKVVTAVAGMTVRSVSNFLDNVEQTADEVQEVELVTPEDFKANYS